MKRRNSCSPRRVRGQARKSEPDGPAPKGRRSGRTPAPCIKYIDTYDYDAIYRVVRRQEGSLGASGDLLAPPQTTQEFTLDGLGNWNDHRKNAAVYTQTINSLNQYTRFNDPSGTWKLSFDFTGNLISESLSTEETRQYAYDFLNRQVSAMDAWNGLATYRYDALGRRISKTRSDLSQTRFIYDGDRLIEERDGSNTLEASYAYGPGPDEVLTRRRWSGGVWADVFYHTNALGSVTALTSSTGLVIERYSYDAYGQVTFLSPSFTPLTGSAVANPILFSGRYHDAESGLYHHRARTYHPRLGRFLQRDPLGESAGLNLYNYVFNNPVNDTDPSGLLSGFLAEEYARTHGSSERAYRERLAGDAEAERQAEEALRQLDGYTAMEDSFQAGIDARKAAHWEAWYAERQQERNAGLDSEIQASLQDPQNMKNMENPKGVAVIVYGLGQSAAAEQAGIADKTQLDDKAQSLKNQGYVVIEVNADTLAQVGKFNEASDSGVKILSDAVMAISGAGSMPVEIDAFSRGAGGAVKLANRMTSTGLDGLKLTVNLTDPFMGPGSHTIDDPWARVNVSRTSGFHWQNLGLSIAAGIAGFVRDVSQRALGQPSAVRPRLYDLKHTEMDYLQPFGALAP